VLIKLYAVERPTSLMEQDLGPTPCVMAPHPWCHRRAIQAGRAWATVDLPAKFANAPDKQWVQMVSETRRASQEGYTGVFRASACAYMRADCGAGGVYALLRPALMACATTGYLSYSSSNQWTPDVLTMNNFHQSLYCSEGQKPPASVISLMC
jgi:hypothetical protein